MGRHDGRGRNWSFVGYPDDSLPANYREILCDEMHLCYCESPVHDADLNGDGSEKKKHIHFVLTFEGNKSFDQIKEITDRLGCPIPQQVRNMRAMVRYLIHADNPDKHQYKREDIYCSGGFELDDYFVRGLTENRNILKEIMDFCVNNDIIEFAQLVEVVFKMDNNEWIDIITCRNTLFLSAYLKSRRYWAAEEYARERAEETENRTCT